MRLRQPGLPSENTSKRYRTEEKRKGWPPRETRDSGNSPIVDVFFNRGKSRGITISLQYLRELGQRHRGRGISLQENQSIDINGGGGDGTTTKHRGVNKREGRRPGTTTTVLRYLRDGDQYSTLSPTPANHALKGNCLAVQDRSTSIGTDRKRYIHGCHIGFKKKINYGNQRVWMLVEKV